jgi:hypothetical protein
MTKHLAAKPHEKYGQKATENCIDKIQHNRVEHVGHGFLSRRLVI